MPGDVERGIGVGGSDAENSGQPVSQRGQRAGMLRSWYLARLRKAALENKSQSLTPAGLIGADRELIESIVRSAARDPLASKPIDQDLSSYAVRGLLVVALLASLWLGALGLLADHEQSGLGHSLVLIAALLLLLVGAAAALVETRLLSPLAKVSARLARLANDPSSETSGRKASGDRLEPRVVDSGAIEPGKIEYRKIDRQVETLIRQRDEHASGETLIADVTTDLIACLDESLIVLAINRAVQEILGFLPEEMLGRQLTGFCLPDDREKLHTSFLTVKAQETTADFEVRALSKAGKAVDLKLSVEWSRHENSYFICAANITDQKTLERARREFVATISHDIKAPLASVLITVQSIESGTYGELGAKCQHALERTERSIHRLIKLIGELLDYEKMSAGKMPLAITTVEIPELIRAAVSEVQPQLDRDKIEIKVDCAEISVPGDPDKLLRVVVNLLSNAIKYSGPGSIVEVRAKHRDGLAEVRVKDNGPGIAPEYKQLVFERYERIKAHEELTEGAGLGLAICKSIIDSHGGRIGVDSGQGTGSEFWFCLPDRH